MPAVHAHLAEPERAAEREAGLVLRKDAAQEFPEPAPRALVHERLHRGTPSPAPAPLARDVDGEVGHARIGGPRRSVRRRRRPRGPPSPDLHDEVRGTPLEATPQCTFGTRRGFVTGGSGPYS